MSVIIPKTRSEQERAVCKPLPGNNGTDTLLSASTAIIEQRVDVEQAPVEVFVNKSPKWNEQLGAFVLNFNKRVTQASVKNFQLVHADDEKNVRGRTYAWVPSTQRSTAPVSAWLC